MSMAFLPSLALRDFTLASSFLLSDALGTADKVLSWSNYERNPYFEEGGSFCLAMGTGSFPTW